MHGQIEWSRRRTLLSFSTVFPPPFAYYGGLTGFCQVAGGRAGSGEADGPWWVDVWWHDAALQPSSAGGAGFTGASSRHACSLKQGGDSEKPNLWRDIKSVSVKISAPQAG